MGFNKQHKTSSGPYATERDMELREDERMALWRESQFARLGFDEPEIASLLEAQADYHDAARLLGRGCPHDRVVAILA